METVDDILTFTRSEGASIEDSGNKLVDIDVGSDLESEDFLKEEFIDLIKGEPEEDPLALSAFYDLEGYEHQHSTQDGELEGFVLEEEAISIDVQKTSACTEKTETEQKNLGLNGFGSIIARKPEEDPRKAVNSQLKAEEHVASFSHTEFGLKLVDENDSANGFAPEPVLNESSQPFAMEEGQRILEEAVDDWYRRLVIHGPVGNDEILEAAHQLAGNFNIDFSPDWEFLKNFKMRLESRIPCMGGNSDVSAGNSHTESGVLLIELEHPEPPEKRLRVGDQFDETPAEAKAPSENSSTKQFLSTSDINALIGQLVECLGLPRDRAVHWLNQFMAQLIVWVITQSNTQKLGLYPVRLKVASLATQLGIPRFTVDDEFYIKMKHHRPNSFMEIDILSTRVSLNPFCDSVAEWYDAEASRRLVTPGELEMKAFGRTQSVKPKDFIRKFIGHYGLYCDINGKRNLFRKPRVGLLRCRFEIAYIVWYYDWPGEIDSVIVNGCYVEGECWVLLKRYMAALTEWFLEISPSTELTPAVIEAQEVELAELMCSPLMNMDVWKAWQKMWVVETARILIGIRYFSTALEIFCKKYQHINKTAHQPSLFNISRWILQKKACEIAATLGILFQPTKKWFRSWITRIVESNANYFTEGKMLEHREKFDLSFEQWYIASGSVVKSVASINRESSYHAAQRVDNLINEFNVEIKDEYLKQSQKGRVKYVSLKEMAEDIAHRKGLRKFEATTVWMKSFMVSMEASCIEHSSVKHGSQATSSSKKVFTTHAKVCKSLEEPDKQAKQKGTKVGRDVVSRSSGQLTVPPELPVFTDAFSKWYVNESLVRTVLPGELERKYVEIAGQLKGQKVNPTKRDLEQLTGKYGLCGFNEGNRYMFMEASAGVSKKMFEVDFLLWYHQWPYAVEEIMMAEFCRWAGSQRGVEFRRSFRFYKTALIKACAEEPNATSCRILEIERQTIKKMVTWDCEFNSLMVKWSKEMTNIIGVINGFNAVMVRRYRENSKVWQTSDEIIALAEQTAQTLGLQFHVSRPWLKRFVELNGLHVMKAENAEVRWTLISSDKILDMGNEVFEEMFDAWWNQEYYHGNVNDICSIRWNSVKPRAHIYSNSLPQTGI